MTNKEYILYQDLAWAALLKENDDRISRGEPPLSWEEFKQFLMKQKDSAQDPWVHKIDALRVYDYRSVSVALDVSKSKWILRKQREMMEIQAVVAEKENMSMNVDSPPTAQHIPAAKTFVGTPAPRSMAKSSVSVKSSARPLNDCEEDRYNGIGTNLERNFDTAAAAGSVVSSLGLISIHNEEIESVVEQKEGLKTQDDMVKDAGLNDFTILAMATDSETYLETLTEMNPSKADRLNMQLMLKKDNLTVLSKDLDSEEAKHNSSISSTEEQIQDTDLQILSYQNELEGVSAKKERALITAEAKYKKEVDRVNDAAKVQQQNIEGDLERAVSRKEKLGEVLESKKKIKRQCVGLTRRLSQLIKSAHNVFILWRIGNNRGGDWSDAQAASDQHMEDQKAYAEMQKEFD